MFTIRHDTDRINVNLGSLVTLKKGKNISESLEQ